MWLRRASLLLALAVTSLAARAEDAAAPPAAAEPAPAGSDAADFRSKVYEYRSAGSDLRRPASEITVTADRTEWQASGITRCTGNVRLVSDTMELRGDELELRQYDDGRLAQAHVSGEPAQLTDAATDTSPPITAHAKKLDYDAKTSIVELSGGAVLTRGNDNVTGESIRYDVAQRRVQATGGSSGQVKIVIQPATQKRALSPAPETPAVQKEPPP